MVHQSGRVFRTILYGWRQREKSVPLACRQTSVFRHGWISHTQDDIVHSRALDVLRERDRIFGGLGLHPLQQVVARLPWGHNVRLLDTVKEGDARAWYARQAIQYGWSRDILGVSAYPPKKVQQALSIAGRMRPPAYS